MSFEAFEASGSALRVLPIGGCGEVGLNSTLLLDGSDGLLIDCGILPGLPDAPGVERAIPDFSPLSREGRRLRAVVLTHGHEDHIGAIKNLLAEHEVPVYGPPLAIALLRARFEGSAAREALLTPIPIGSTLELGPYKVEWVRVTHSLPDSAALFVESASGRVLHSGDFKLDSAPVDGVVTDLSRLRAIAEGGVDLLLSDSTNSERPGRTGTEHEVALEIERLVREAEGRVVIACFASHLHRLQGIVRAARATGRRIALLGKALHTTWRVGLETRHLVADPGLVVDEKRIDELPRNGVILVVTGSQGEARAGLSRVASGAEPALRVRRGDRVILSASTIPGNDRAVRKMVNAVVRHGAEVVHDGMHPVHCSGHAHAEELADFLRMIAPKHFVPVHGERVMLEAHAKIARAAGVPEERIRVVEDGQSVVLAGGRLFRGASEKVEPRPIDAESRQPIGWPVIEERKRIAASGLISCTILIDERGLLLAPPAVHCLGLPETPDLDRSVAREVAAALAPLAYRHDVDRKEAAVGAVRRAASVRLNARPVVSVRLVTPGADERTG